MTEVSYQGGHRLFLRFNDGEAGVVDLSTRLEFTGVFRRLSDPSEFARVFLDGESIAWPDGADIDPEVLWSIVSGKPIPWAADLSPLQIER